MPRTNTREDFHKKYIKTDSCWVWQDSTARSGYGSFSFQGKSYAAHRWSYEEVKGPIPKGLHLDHLCRNRACVNPDHLEAVTPKENILRGIGPAAINHRKTHCSRGHEYTKENTIVSKKTGRWCKICDRAQKDKWDAEHPEKQKAFQKRWRPAYRRKPKWPAVCLACHKEFWQKERRQKYCDKKCVAIANSIRFKGVPKRLSSKEESHE